MDAGGDGGLEDWMPENEAGVNDWGDVVLESDAVLEGDVVHEGELG